MAAPKLNITITPVTKKAKGNTFDRFINAHPQLRQYKVSIQQWAGEYGVPAIWLAATLAFEHGYDKNGTPLNTPNAEGTGFGLGQINPQFWFGKTFKPTGETITAQWASQPGNAIQFMAYQLSTQAAVQGTLNGTYTAAYNPGYKGPGPQSLLKGFDTGSLGSVGTTPTQKAAGTSADAQAKQALIVNQQQTLGKELVSQFKTTKTKLDPLYLAYTGKAATPIDVQHFINNPSSTYQIELNLANPKNNPALYKSPVWQTNSARYQQYYRDVFGQNVKVPNSAVLYGVVHSLDETSFKGLLAKDQLPGQGTYTTSEQYKGLYAQYQSSYANIYGLPTEDGQKAIGSAIKNGWTDAQWSTYLRQLPGYTSSGEYKERSLALASSMGLVANTGGGQTALGAGGSAAPSATSQITAAA